MTSMRRTILRMLATLVALFVVCATLVTLADRTRDAVYGEQPGVDARGSERRPDELLENSIARLRGMDSIFAEIEINGQMFGRRYEAVGEYAEIASQDDDLTEGARYYLFAKMNAKEKKKKKEAKEEDLLQVYCGRSYHSDGRIWWRSYSFAEEDDSKISLVELQTANVDSLLNDLKIEESNYRVLKENGVRVEPDLDCDDLPGMGGMVGTLRWIQANFDFEPDATEEDGTTTICGAVRDDSALYCSVRERYSNKIAMNLPTNVEASFNSDGLPVSIVYYSVFGERPRVEIEYEYFSDPNGEGRILDKRPPRDMTGSESINAEYKTRATSPRVKRTSEDNAEPNAFEDESETALESEDE